MWVTGAVNRDMIPSLSNAGNVYACTAWLSVATYNLLSLKQTASALSPTQWELGSSSSISNQNLTSPSWPHVMMCLELKKCSVIFLFCLLLIGKC